jgi:hypothetical protein
MSAAPSYFEVDKDGLAQILERRGKGFLVTELWQNARDENVTRVVVSLTACGHGYTLVSVHDDSPDGWSNLRDSYTLFSPSYKKGDPLKSGRFNLGEKLVLALARRATIRTMNGAVEFGPSGRTESRAAKDKTITGTVFEAEVKMNADERAEALKILRTMIVPEHITLVINGEVVPHREPVATFRARLETERADEDGNLKGTNRVGEVNVYEPLPGETATLYELGIPVVETGDRFHVSVEQKVRVSLDRTGLVTPGFLRDIRAEVLNHTADLLTEAEASERWVSAALEDERIEAEAVETTLTTRFGENRVVYDPSDREANRIAMSKGYTVIPAASFSKAAWKQVREAEAALPAGRVTPSPDPYANGGADLQEVPHDGYEELVDYAQEFGLAVLGYTPRVRLVDDRDWGFRATFGPGHGLTLNLPTIRKTPGNPDLDDLLIHEFAHEYGGHLEAKYDAALSAVGAAAIAAVREGKLAVNGAAVLA